MHIEPCRPSMQIEPYIGNMFMGYAWLLLHVGPVHYVQAALATVNICMYMWRTSYISLIKAQGAEARKWLNRGPFQSGYLYPSENRRGAFIGEFTAWNLIVSWRSASQLWVCELQVCLSVIASCQSVSHWQVCSLQHQVASFADLWWFLMTFLKISTRMKSSWILVLVLVYKYF